MSACETEIAAQCPKTPNLECLKSMKHSEMSPQCRKAVFAEEREEVCLSRDWPVFSLSRDHVGLFLFLQAMQNKLDAGLMKTCAGETQRHCEGVEGPNGILDCLQVSKLHVSLVVSFLYPIYFLSGAHF